MGVLSEMIAAKREAVPSLMEAQFLAWRLGDEALAGGVTTSALVAEVLALLPEAGDALKKAAVMVAKLADEAYPLAYHNHHHFREVMFLSSFLAVKTEALSDDARLKVVISAMGHDLGHDGVGNTKDGVHVPYRLEDIAFGKMAPFLKAAGVRADVMAELKVLVRCTDVSSPKGGRSPHHACKDFLREGTALDNDDLALLARDEKLQKMAAILCDADLLPSAGLSLGFLKAQSEALAEEGARVRGEVYKEGSVKPAGALYFLEQIASGGFLSEMGKAYFNDSYFKILEAVRAEVKAVAEREALAHKKTAPVQTPFK
jgi:hypothetical protein